MRHPQNALRASSESFAFRRLHSPQATIVEYDITRRSVNRYYRMAALGHVRLHGRYFEVLTNLTPLCPGGGGGGGHSHIWAI